jgi:hypothetical protein
MDHSRPGAKRGRLRRRLTAAALIKRVFGTDVLKCDECPGRMRIIVNIEEPALVTRILRHLGLPMSSPVPRAAGLGGVAAKRRWCMNQNSRRFLGSTMLATRYLGSRFG